MSQPPVQQSSEINMGDFNSMQLLFKTNSVQPNIQQQSPVQKPAVGSFNQQFATINASTTQSPNNMLMNTYGGSTNSANLSSFDMSLGGNQQQLNTSSVNPSMMKKKTSTSPVVQQSSNAVDLL